MRSKEEVVKAYWKADSIRADSAFQGLALELLADIRDVLVSLKEDEECNKEIK